MSMHVGTYYMYFTKKATDALLSMHSSSPSILPCIIYNIYICLYIHMYIHILCTYVYVPTSNISRFMHPCILSHCVQQFYIRFHFSLCMYVYIVEKCVCKYYILKLVSDS